MKQKRNSNISQEEKRTAFVVVFSAITMILEIAFGAYSNSMALLANGIHMGAHVLVIGLSWAAYVMVRKVRRFEENEIMRKQILNLAAYTSGLLLFVFAFGLIFETAHRLFDHPVDMRYHEALLITAIGFVVNLICAVVLHDKHSQDFNRYSAYMHVASDVLTSIGAIVGILCAMWWNITWVDSFIAIIFAFVIARWAFVMLVKTGKQLLGFHSELKK